MPQKSARAIAQCDVTDRDAIDRAFDEARAANGPIDILVVNAGIAESAPFHKMTRESWDRIIATNLTGAFDCAQAALPDLLKSDNGRLVFIASVASLRGIPYAAHYGASKHGLLGLSRSLAAEYARSTMTVNAVCPGYVDTPMTDQSVARVVEKTGRSDDDARAAITNMNASGRLVDPDGMATLVLTLCLPQIARHQWRGADHRRRQQRVSIDPGYGRAAAFPVGFRRRRRDDHAQPAGAQEPADVRELRRAARHFQRARRDAGGEDGRADRRGRQFLFGRRRP